MFKKKKFKKISNDFIKKDQLIETWMLVEKNVFKDISVSYNNARQVLELLISNVHIRINGVYDNNLTLFEMMDDFKLIKFINNDDIIRRMHSIRKSANQGSHGGLKDRKSLNYQNSEHTYVDLCIVLNYILLLLNDINEPIVFDVNKLPTVVGIKTLFIKIFGEKKQSRNFQNSYDYTRRNAPGQTSKRKTNHKNTNKKNYKSKSNEQPKKETSKPISKSFERKYLYDDVMVFGGSSNLNEVKLHLNEFFTPFNATKEELDNLADFNRSLQSTLDKNKYSTTLLFEKFDYIFTLNNQSYVSNIQVMGKKGSDLIIKFELKEK